MPVDSSGGVDEVCLQQAVNGPRFDVHCEEDGLALLRGFC